jgi:hypothetical protein
MAEHWLTDLVEQAESERVPV